MEAVGFSISYGLEDRWASQGQAVGVGWDRIYSKYGDLLFGFCSLGMWLSLPCFPFGWHLPEHWGELPLPACIT